MHVQLLGVIKLSESRSREELCSPYVGCLCWCKCVGVCMRRGERGEKVRVRERHGTTFQTNFRTPWKKMEGRSMVSGLFQSTKLYALPNTYRKSMVNFHTNSK